MSVAVKFEKRDLWLGVFWDIEEGLVLGPQAGIERVLVVYLCLIPCFPIIFRRVIASGLGGSTKEKEA